MLVGYCTSAWLKRLYLWSSIYFPRSITVATTTLRTRQSETHVPRDLTAAVTTHPAKIPKHFPFLENDYWSKLVIPWKQIVPFSATRPLHNLNFGRTTDKRSLKAWIIISSLPFSAGWCLRRFKLPVCTSNEDVYEETVTYVIQTGSRPPPAPSVESL